MSSEGRLPGFDGATGWLNSPPLTAGDVRGKVVLVDFWTYTCINWLRTLAYVRAWGEKYQDRGLVIVGVHTPEFPFEQDVDNVHQAVKDMGIGYPIAIDSDYGVWRAFGNHYWPAVYIADAQGQIRHHQFGEGRYEECERVIQRLLREAGVENVGGALVSVAADGFETQADWTNLGSPETYLGYEQTQNFASPGGVAFDESRTYVAPDPLRLNHWALSGDWTIESGASLLNGAGGGIAFRFHARDVHLVLRGRERGTSVPFRVRIDGEPPGDAHGLDVDEDGHGTVAHPRLYQLVRERGPITDRTFEITFLAPGIEAYVFTFASTMRRSVATFPKLTEAEVAQGLLASAGIAACVVADDAGGAFPFALSGGAPLDG
jgi:thiol-disulfide isomerase/thioredoxin